MRSARLVGLSPDGRWLVVATDTGDELAVAADDRLREALRGLGVRHGRLETPMDSSLSPRDIQARIRAGASLEEVTEAAGMPLERVERFAAPVLAEREHVAIMAAASSVRRRGETSGHRNLRATVAEQLLKRGVDADSIGWDAHRLDDGRWAVTADYALSGEAQRGTFLFDLRGRFSVPGDEASRWLVGEQAPTTGTRRRRGDEPSAADEPTVDLSDELALVRAVQDDPPRSRVQDVPPVEVTEVVVREQTELTVVRALRRVPPPLEDPAPDEEAVDGGQPDEQPVSVVPAESAQAAAPGSGDGAGGDDESDAEDADWSVHDRPGNVHQASVEEDAGELAALYSMLGSDGYSEDSPRVYAGLSDASAVPETAAGQWEPPVAVAFPVEPSPEEETSPPGEQRDRGRAPAEDPFQPTPDRPEAEAATADGPAGTGAAASPQEPTADAHAAEGPGGAEGAEGAEEFQLESEPAPSKPAKRKRASVPSWDEIMFGGPKPPS